jgi:hypothetical protein
MIRRAVVGSLDTAHRVHQLAGIENVCNHNLGAATLEQIAARVPDTDGGWYWPTGSSGCAGYQNFRINHGERRGSSNSVRGTITYLNDQ